MSGTSDPKQDYDAKKKFLEDLKTLDKADYEQMFRILKENAVEYTENSNGIFFDLLNLTPVVFEKLQGCVSRNRKQKNLEQERAATVEALLSVNARA